MIIDMNWSFNFTPVAFIPTQTQSFYFMGVPVASPNLLSEPKPA